MVTRQLQAERRTGSVHWPKTSVLPAVLRNHLFFATLNKLLTYLIVNSPDNITDIMYIITIMVRSWVHGNGQVLYQAYV